MNFSPGPERTFSWLAVTAPLLTKEDLTQTGIFAGRAIRAHLGGEEASVLPAGILSRTETVSPLANCQRISESKDGCPRTFTRSPFTRARSSARSGWEAAAPACKAARTKRQSTFIIEIRERK